MSGAAIYTRISRDTEGLGLGVERQRKDCAALAQRAGLDVVETIVDNDVGASKGKPRVGYQRLCELIESGSIDTVIAWHPDRLTRMPRELEDLVDLLEGSGARVVTVQAGEYDLSTASGRMVARVVGAMARAEVERKSERQKAKAAELAAAGKVGGGGHRPFGFEADRITHRPEEADAIRWATAEVIGGKSLRNVVARMPIPTSQGKAWSAMSLRRTLIAPRTAGLREHRKEIVGPAVWAPIVDRGTWEKCRAVLTDPRRSKWRPTQRYLLTGGLAVDHLGRQMFARPTDYGRRGYKTLPNELGPGVYIDAVSLDEYIVDAVEHALTDSVDEATNDIGYVDVSPAEGNGAALGELECLEAELAELATLRGDGSITLAEWMAARTPLLERIESAKLDVPVAARIVDLRDLYEFRRWDINRQRDLVSGLFEKIEVGPGVKGRNTFDPSRVTAHPRTRAEVARLLTNGWWSPTMPARYRAEAKADLAIEQYDRIFKTPQRTTRAKPGPTKRAPAPTADGTRDRQATPFSQTGVPE